METCFESCGVGLGREDFALAGFSQFFESRQLFHTVFRQRRRLARVELSRFARQNGIECVCDPLKKFTRSAFKTKRVAFAFFFKTGTSGEFFESGEQRLFEREL